MRTTDPAGLRTRKENLVRRLLRRRAGYRIAGTSLIRGGRKVIIGPGCKIDDFCLLRAAGEHGRLILGRSVRIREYAYISAREATVWLEDFVFVAHGAWLGGRGNIRIGRNSMIGVNTVLISSNHDYSHIREPYYFGEEIAADIDVGADVWIGASCVILPGVRVGAGSVIGAGSVVVTDVAANTLVAGTPATVKRELEDLSFRKTTLQSMSRYATPH